jgi:pimeloyl-ACP methyl ester carboxylesterase
MLRYCLSWLIVGFTVAVLSPGCTLAGELGEPVEMSFKAKVDKTVQKYVVMLPKNFDPKKQHHVLIVLHGHGSDRWQYVKQSRSECKGARDMAARHDLIFVSPDYRASTSWMGPKAEADMVQLIALLRRKYKVGKVLMAGASMGGASVLIFAALHPTLVQGVISQNGMANMIEYEMFQKAIAASYGGDKKQKPREYRKRSPELAPKRFTMPIAFTVGGKDTAVPPDSVRRLVARLEKLKKKDVLLIDRKNRGHSTSYEDTVTAMEYVIKAAGVAKEEEKKADEDADGKKNEQKDDEAPPKSDKKSDK